MKNIFKITILFIMLSVTLQSCTKSKEEKMNEFVNIYNTSIASSGALITSNLKTSAEITGDNEITIEMVSINENQFEQELLNSSITDLLEISLAEEEVCKDLYASGVKLKVEVLNNNGKILSSNVLDLNKKKPETESLVNKTKTEQLQVMFDAFNKNLPYTDKETGIKILKVKAGTDNDVIYMGEVPDEIAPLFKEKTTLELVKKEILQNPQIKNILQNVKTFKLDKIKYQYNDTKGNKLGEVLITMKDLK